MNDKNLIVDGVKWSVTGTGDYREVQPLCPKHYLRLSLESNNYGSCHLKCAECNERYNFPRDFTEQKQYILNKIDSKIFKNTKFINLDDEAVPLAESKVKSEDDRYFVTAKLVESKVGLRLVVYAGEQGKPKKTQIFVEPDIKRIGFDQSDLHPSDVFIKLEGTFNDGTSYSINKTKNKDKI